MIQRHTIQAVCGIDAVGGDFPSFCWMIVGVRLGFIFLWLRCIRAGISAQLLEEQVKTLIEQSGYANEWVDWPGARRRQDFRYCEIWFVAHSLGAPLVRQMLVDAARQQAAWLDISHLICFAPASTGARIERLMWSLGTTAGGMMGLLHAIFRYRWTVLDDLRVGSNFLKNLSHETARASRGADREPFTSRLTLFGIYEDVIEYPPPFRFDNQVRLIRDADYLESIRSLIFVSTTTT